MQLTIVDYVVIVILLIIPLGIGFFFAWKDARKADREEYLLGGRRMGMVPVALSLFVTFQSAIAIMGVAGDVYQHGSMIIGVYLGNSLCCIVACFVMIPIMHPLRLTSVYEYLEMRFKSRGVRMFCTLVGMFQTFLYMVVAMLAPGLALQAVADIPFWVSVAVVGCSGTVYTAIGGIKSVIWTDVFQTLVLVIGLAFLIVIGTVEVGGASKVWNVAQEGGRTSIANFDPDPRTRYSWWGLIIGASVTWLTSTFSQSSVQRVSSMKSIKSAKQTYLWTIPCHCFFGTVITAIGVITYSYFSVMRCDPIKGGLISNVNQISLYFMMHVFKNFPGLAGLYMAAVFSGALSTLSSGINALTANTLEDIFKRKLNNFSEGTVVVFAKFMVFIYGFGIVGVTYLAKSLQGPVTEMTFSVFGVCGSVLVGIFLIGSTVPWANKYGAFAGGIVSFVVNAWIAVGARFYGKRRGQLPSPPIDQCNYLSNDSHMYNYSSSWPTSSYSVSSYTNASSIVNISDRQESVFFLYDVSFVWYGLIGTMVNCSTSLIVSKMTNRLSDVKTSDARFIIPALRNFWFSDVLNEANSSELESLKI